MRKNGSLRSHTDKGFEPVCYWIWLEFQTDAIMLIRYRKNYGPNFDFWPVSRLVKYVYFNVPLPCNKYEKILMQCVCLILYSSHLNKFCINMNTVKPVLTLCMLGNIFQIFFSSKFAKKSLFPTNFLCLYII